ncbi:MAG: TonB-dependent receptor [Parvularculaceae bacterium]|nr:TonB-dependent receptor [Parvularculaceae bacterium]
MKLAKILAASVAMSALTAAAVTPTVVLAQEVTSQIRGSVVGPSGEPVAGATVTVTDTRTGSVRRATTNNNGAFTIGSLVPGGPYSVSVASDQFRGGAVTDVFTKLGSTAEIAIALEARGAGSDDEIVVTATRSNVAQVAIGPSSAFDQSTLESFPSIQRDIRDIIRFDPRVSIDLAGEVPRVSCLGGNDRSNTFTVDGVIRADVFGLNGTPFASRNTLVIPFDAISQTTIEFAPYDVQYGQFTGCNINVVTKSGTNEFHGSAFFNYAGSSLQGDETDGNKFTVFPYDDFNWGASIGGPVIKDKLFFFAAYEETDDGDPQLDGPIGGGFANEGTENEPDLASVQQVQSILESVYGINTGGIASTLPQSSRRILGRVDYLITDDHRLEFTYDRLREENTEPDDFGFEPVGFTFFNSFESEGTKSETYSARLFSQWSENFSTEIRASRADVLDLQGPVGGGEAQSGNPVPRIIVGTGTFGGQPTSVGAGPGQFRSANELDTQVDQLRVEGNYKAGGHSITVGYELNQLDVFNLFVSNATGTLFFNNITDLQNGVLSGGTDDFVSYADLNGGVAVGATGNFAFSGNVNDAAASFSRSIHSIYVQDEWQPTDNLSVVAGLRYEFYSGNDSPLGNPNFEARYGFRNDTDFAGLKAALPRLGLTYDAPFDFNGSLQFRLGAGIFTGGDPSVWFSNAFSNSGNLNGSGALAGSLNTQGCTAADRQVIVGGVFTGVPQCVIDAGSAQASLALGDTQSTDPNLKLASIIRSNAGVTWETDFGGAAGGFFDNWRVDLDYIHTQFRNPYTFVDLSQTINTSLAFGGIARDGRPVFAAIDPTRAGCNATLVGTGGNNPQYTNVSAACFGTGRDDEIQLTNGPGYFSQAASIILGKDWDYTLPVLGTEGSARFSVGYAWTDSNNRRDLTSAQSTSNFDGTALVDRQNPSVATSGFETRNNITARLNLRNEFIKDYATSFGLFFNAQSGRPYSFVFNGGGDFADSASGTNNALLYIPTGPTDPVVTQTASSQAAVTSLLNFIATDERAACIRGVSGAITPRNTCKNDWFLDLDLRLQQELPVPGTFLDDRLVLFADVDNFMNLISSGANLRRLVNTTIPIVDVAVDPATGSLTYSGFNPNRFNERVDVFASVWALQVGVRFEF